MFAQYPVERDRPFRSIGCMIYARWLRWTLTGQRASIRHAIWSNHEHQRHARK